MYVIYPTVVKVVVDKTSSKVVNRRGINKTGGEEIIIIRIIKTRS